MRLCAKRTRHVRSLGWEINQAAACRPHRGNGGSKDKMAGILHLPPETGIVQVLI